MPEFPEAHRMSACISSHGECSDHEMDETGFACLHCDFDDIGAMCARIAELEAFVADLACHGLRADLHPTMDCRTRETYEEGMQRYLERVDASLRKAARQYVPDAAVPYNQGRPSPAPTEKAGLTDGE